MGHEGYWLTLRRRGARSRTCLFVCVVVIMNTLGRDDSWFSAAFGRKPQQPLKERALVENFMALSESTHSFTAADGGEHMAIQAVLSLYASGRTTCIRWVFEARWSVLVMHFPCHKCVNQETGGSQVDGRSEQQTGRMLESQRTNNPTINGGATVATTVAPQG